MVRRVALVGLIAAAVLVAGLWRSGGDSPRRWSVVLIVAEPTPDQWGAGEGPRPKTPRMDRLAGAGVRLPLAPAGEPLGAWTEQLLGGPAPARSLLDSLSVRGWATVAALGDAGSETLGAQLDTLTDGGVDSAVAAVDALVPAQSSRALVVVGAIAADGAALDRIVGRLIDGLAPWLPPAEMLVVVVDRGRREALLVGPDRPKTLDVRGALSAAQLGDEIARWLRIPLDGT